MTDSREQRGKEIQDAIREILYRDWDPIGVCDVAPKNEYDAYIGRIYRLLADKSDWKVIADELVKIERNEMGFDGIRTGSLQSVAEKLLAVDIRL